MWLRPNGPVHAIASSKGKDDVVRVRSDGFESDGRLTNSLSAAARVAAGTWWNGFAPSPSHVSNVALPRYLIFAPTNTSCSPPSLHPNMLPARAPQLREPF